LFMKIIVMFTSGGHHEDHVRFLKLVINFMIKFMFMFLIVRWF